MFRYKEGGKDRSESCTSFGIRVLRRKRTPITLIPTRRELSSRSVVEIKTRFLQIPSYVVRRYGLLWTPSDHFKCKPLWPLRRIQKDLVNRQSFTLDSTPTFHPSLANIPSGFKRPFGHSRNPDRRLLETSDSSWDNEPKDETHRGSTIGVTKGFSRYEEGGCLVERVQ